MINTQGLPPYVPPYEGYGDLLLEGLIYSWGDANIYAGTPGLKYDEVYKYDPVEQQYKMMPDYGTVKIQGALVAYGADPGAFEKGNPLTGPGSDGTGRIGLFGWTAEVIYDSTKLVSEAETQQPGGGLPGVNRVSYGFEN